MKVSGSGLFKHIAALGFTLSTLLGHAAPIVDQSFSAVGGGASIAVQDGQGLAQVLTVGLGGLLTEVDIQVDRQAAATGTFSLSILSASGGVPGGDGSSLFIVTRPVSDITTIGPFNYNFLSFDVSGAGLFVTPGEQLAIAVLHASLGYPDWVQWETNSGAGAFHGNGSLTTTWQALAGVEFGYRTFVDTNATAQVPEPASLALLALGLFALGLCRKQAR